MSLLDKLRVMADEDPNRDLLEFFGVGPNGFSMEGGRVVVGGESVSLKEARDAVFGPIPQAPEARRTVTIGDL